jgi:putative transposase
LKTTITPNTTAAFKSFRSQLTPLTCIHAGNVPIDRFNLDHSRINFLCDDEYTEEVFFVEETRKVSKTNVFSINSKKYECPVDLREKAIQVRYDRTRRNRFIVFFKDQRMGEAALLNLYYNASATREGEVSS